jgi:hypothetical protein
MSKPTDAQFFSKEDKSKPDVAFLKNHFYREGRLTEEQALWILVKGTELLRAEPNILNVDAPITGESHILDAVKTGLDCGLQSVGTFTDNMQVPPLLILLRSC